MKTAAPAEPPLVLTFGELGDELQPGDRLGNWRLVSELGVGGMGRVYLAERSDGHYQQRAAVKMLQGWNSDEGLAQLARERQILASLAHPHIARLIDGGTTPLGRPYLVMDYVEGVPIHQYVRGRRLDTSALLGLFQQVLHAVAYAHRQLVVHCDLKPGNVLVTAEGRAMLLDFGIARLQSGGGETVHDAMSWTPRYASPEQQRGLKPGIPSDIFGLGRMLEDLLALVQPPAPRPREWRAIVARATAEDPDRRYATALSMSEDLRRYLEHRPVHALPQRVPYVLAKLLRRRWPWALVAAAGVVLSAAFTLQVMHERDRARAAERQALTEAATTRAVSDFVISLFEGADPAVSGQRDMPASVLIERGRERIESDLPGQPALQAAMKAVLGKVFENTGRSAVAEQLYRQAADLERRPDVDRPQQRAKVLSRLANQVANAGRASEAVAPAREALALVEAQGTPDPLLLAEVLNTLGRVLAATGNFDEAEQRLQQSLELRTARLPAHSAEIGATLHNLGLLHGSAGRYAESERFYRRSLEVKLQRVAEGHPSTFVTLEGLGRTLARQRRLAEAEALFHRALEQRRAYYGENSPSVASVFNELGNVLQDAGRTADAVQAYRDSVRINGLTAERGTMSQAIAVNNLATALEESGDMPAAEAAYRRSLELRQGLLEAGDLGLVRARHNLGRFLMRTGRTQAARPLIEAALAERTARLPRAHGEVVVSLLTTAELEAVEGRAEAMAGALARLQVVASQLDASQRADFRRLQGRLAALQARAADAVEALEDAQRQAAAVWPEGHPVLQRFALDFAEALAGQGQADRARQLLMPLQPALAAHGAGSPLRRRAERLLAAAGSAR